MLPGYRTYQVQFCEYGILLDMLCCKDGHQISFKCPPWRMDSDVYRNYKNWYYINVQGVCTPLQFSNTSERCDCACSEALFVQTTFSISTPWVCCFNPAHICILSDREHVLDFGRGNFNAKCIPFHTKKYTYSQIDPDTTNLSFKLSKWSTSNMFFQGWCLLSKLENYFICRSTISP